MMLNRIPARLTASILAFLALILLTALATGYYLEGYRADATRVHLVVRQAARAVALGRQAALYTPDTHDQVTARMWALRQAFEHTHQALSEGGTAPSDDSTDATEQCAPLASEPVRDRLTLVKAQWNVVAADLDQLVASKGTDDEARQAVLLHDLELRDNLDATAAMLQKHADDKVAQLFWIQAATTGVGLFLALLILWGTRRDIGLPLRRLVKAAEQMTAGDITTPIDTRGLLYETAELAESFERLRRSLAKSAPRPSSEEEA